MSALAINYVVNPLSGFWKGLQKTFEIAGYAKAAAELSRLGYYEEAKHCMMMVKKIKG
jgi:hypothetical protein